MLECRNITRRFPGVLALDNVSIEFHSGRITGLLGENGAGKSTLMNIIYGIYKPDGGDMILNGESYSPDHPADAIRSHVGMVHQTCSQFDDLSVIENIIAGCEPITRWRMLDMKTSAGRAERILDMLGYRLDPNAQAGSLDSFERQILEIAKLLYRDAEVMIFDEPTSLLAPPQIDRLFELLVNLKNEGKAIILVTHRISEVESVVDDIVVLKQGKLVKKAPSAKTKSSDLVRLIVGNRGDKRRKPPSTTKAKKSTTAGIVLELQSISGAGLNNLSLKIKAGEIVGITGVPGNGQTELIDILSGFKESIGGRIFYNGSEIKSGGLRNRLYTGTGFIYPERDEQGLIPDMSMEDNLLLNYRILRSFSRNGVIDGSKLKNKARDSIEQFSITSASAGKSVSTLSGGNKQKVVLAREAAEDIDLLIAAEPVRGLDIRTTEEVKDILLNMKNRGAGLLIISGDVDFLISISDRIGVMYRGEINYLETAAGLQMNELGRAMLGYA